MYVCVGGVTHLYDRGEREHGVKVLLSRACKHAPTRHTLPLLQTSLHTTTQLMCALHVYV